MESWPISTAARCTAHAILCYLAGSLICALAPNMFVLILGRVVHGIGGGGLTSLGMIVLGDVAAPKDRGRYYVYFSLAYTTAGASGPVLGGFIAAVSALDGRSSG